MTMEDIQFISRYIAPWALPKEDIPIHLVWEPSFSYDDILIELPSDLEIKEFFNVDKYLQEEDKIIIEKLRTSNYLGFTIATKDTISEQHIARKIIIYFLEKERVTHSTFFNANIYRPILSIEDSPEKVTLDDKTDIFKLFNITLKLSGFGNIQIRNECSTGGKFFERAEPLYREIFRNMITTYRTYKTLNESTSLDELTDSKEKGITIDPSYIQNKVKEYIKNIEERMFPLDFQKEDLESFRNWVMDNENKDMIEELISNQVENLIVDSILYFFDKNPEENVQMPQGKPAIFIEDAIQEVRIRFRYNDSMLNQYEPISSIIKVEDLRENKTRLIEIPINTKWLIEIINPLEECE